MGVQLTGNRRHRVNWRGKLILQVEVAGTSPKYLGGRIEMEDVRYWRDASPQDVTVEPSR